MWREKLDALGAWVSAHIEDAAFLGKPVIVEEFGKIIPAKSIYEVHDTTWALLPGERVSPDLAIRNAFFSAVYDQARNNPF